ncbi:MAG: tetratricopeptide repeat protein, partial [Anaerolineae bacterium]|nr:tetratricopeptide repeat protein [Anaerolineae bacterium]
EMVIPLVIVLVISSRTRARQVGWAVVTLVLLYAMGLTYSRGAFIALAVGLVAAGLLRFSPRLALLLVAAVILAGLVLTAAALPQLPLDWVFQRRDLYLNSMRVASDYAFTGIGLGDTFSMVYARYGLLIQVPFLTYPHNLYIAVWMNQGLVGILTFAGLLVAVFLFVTHVMRVGKPGRLFYAAWLALAVTLVHGLFDGRRYVEWWLMPEMLILIGLIVALGRAALAQAVDTEQDVPTNYIPRLLPVGAVIILALLALVFRQQLLAAWHTNLGALDETRAELSPDLSDAEREQLTTNAQAEYALALDTLADWPNANRRLGNLKFNVGEYAAAVPLLETALADETDNPATIKGLGLAYTWIGETEQAAETLAHLPDPGAMIDELFTWSNYRREQGENLLAAYAGDVALTMSGDNTNVNVLILVADLYRDAGETEAAKNWYSRALELEPTNEVARTNLDALN